MSSADGVGTKLKVAFMTGRHDTVGADLVNHCVNDILVQGAEPLFFLDYLATGRLSPDVAEQVVAGMARGVPRERLRAASAARPRRCPASTPTANTTSPASSSASSSASELIDGRAIVPGDVLIGLPSTGLHTNGYSLARRVFFERARPDASTRSCPSSARRSATRCSRRTGRICQRSGRCSTPGSSRGWRTSPAAASPRTCRACCPTGCAATIDRGAWRVPPLFALLQRARRASPTTRCSARSTWASG